MMAFKRLTELELDLGDLLTCQLHGFVALDTERHLVVETTNGRTRNARRWFVRKYNPETFGRDFDSGKITFRAWTLSEALERINEPRIANKIDKLVSK